MTCKICEKERESIGSAFLYGRCPGCGKGGSEVVTTYTGLDRIALGDDITLDGRYATIKALSKRYMHGNNIMFSYEDNVVFLHTHDYLKDTHNLTAYVSDSEIYIVCTEN